MGITRYTTRTLHGSAMLGPSQPYYYSYCYHYYYHYYYYYYYYYHYH